MRKIGWSAALLTVAAACSHKEAVPQDIFSDELPKRAPRNDDSVLDSEQGARDEQRAESPAESGMPAEYSALRGNRIADSAIALWSGKSASGRSVAGVNDSLAGAPTDQLVQVLAADETRLTSIAGALSAGVNTGFGAAADIGTVTKETTAFIDRSAVVNAAGDVRVLADSLEDATSLAAALSVMPTTIASAARAPKTSPSNRELLASRFAPCTPVQAHSPAAYRPGSDVRPSVSVRTPPIR